jgi:hypothetical protein
MTSQSKAAGAELESIAVCPFANVPINARAIKYGILLKEAREQEPTTAGLLAL